MLYATGPLPTVAERLAFLKLNPLQEQHADLFDMEQKQCYQFVHSLKIVPDYALALACVLLAQTDLQLQQVLSAIAPAGGNVDVNLLHDATEREALDLLKRKNRQKNTAAKRKTYG